MCLAVPGRIVSIDDGELRYGKVEFGGIVKPVCLACVPEAVVGDWVVVHVGFAISRLDEAEARRTLSLLSELGELSELESETEQGTP